MEQTSEPLPVTATYSQAKELYLVTVLKRDTELVSSQDGTCVTSQS